MQSEGGINTVLTVQVEVPVSFVTSQRGDFQKCASCMPLSKEKRVLKKKVKEGLISVAFSDRVE